MVFHGDIALQPLIRPHLKRLLTRCGGLQNKPSIRSPISQAQLYPHGDALPSAQLAQYPRLIAMLRALEQRPAVQKAYALEGMDGPVFTAPNYPRDAAV